MNNSNFKRKFPKLIPWEWCLATTYADNFYEKPFWNWYYFKSRGIGLVEILIALTAFLFAVVPIINLFSFNVENAKIIHQRAITYSMGRELIDQLRVIPAHLLPEGEFDLTNESRFRFFKENPDSEVMLSALPPGFSRTVSIALRNPEGRIIRFRVKSTDQPRANFDVFQTFCPGMGGK